jgi:iron complex transport system permease protein
MNKRAFRWTLLILIVLLPLAMIASVAWGSSADISSARALKILLSAIGFHTGEDFLKGQEYIILNLRLPRALIALMVGAALAVAGCALQGLFRNPLAEPGILGVSSGGAFGAVTAIFFMMPLASLASTGQSAAGVHPLSIWILPASAFAGALVSALLVFVIATSKGRTPLATLLLAGIAMNAILSAAVSFLLTLRLGSYDSTRQIIYWLIGGLENRSWLHVKIAVIPIFACVLWLQFMARDLNSISLGEETASSLGVSVQRLKLQVLVLVSVLTGVSVAVSGVLAFVGLIIPQLFRLLVGPDHRRLLPLSALGGSCFLVVIDLASRLIIRPQEIRIGILTSLIGGPFFLLLLLLINRRMGRVE